MAFSWRNRHQDFNSQLAGKEVSLFKLENKAGMSCYITNYGSRIVSLYVADRDMNFVDVVLGYDTLKEYLKDEHYFGALVGRFANRISNASFELDGQVFHINKNSGDNHIHGGSVGFSNVVWDVLETDSSHLKMGYLSADGEQGYPGNVQVHVDYRLSEENELVIKYEGRTDKATPISLTDHSYYNLQGAGNGTVDGHIVRICSDYYAVVDDNGIPTGEIRSVENDGYDQRIAKPLSSRSRVDYDINYALREDGMKLAAEIYEPKTGRKLSLYTSAAGLQFYNACHLNSQTKGKNGMFYSSRSGFCLEPQCFPDSPNRPEFPSSVLRPGAVYRSENRYVFTVDQI
ncbi:MAG: galactose mutarotase [Flavobacteriales bacterium]|nr:galactose mutarotase [Flavobacteriales bacterium]NNK80236.1 galactose mutarotase [Flavobacteriales bacterium]